MDESLNSKIPYIQLFDRDGVLTGIGTVTVDEESKTMIFHINGMPAHNPLAPGLYIIDGKKVLIK